VAGQRWKEIIRPYYLRWLYFPIRGERPDYFDKPWQYPTSTFSQGALRSLIPADSRSPSFLFLPMSDWHARLQRPQHLASALADTGHVSYFLNPHLGRQFPTTYAFNRQSRLVHIASSVIEAHVRLPAEPVYHHRMLTAYESTALADAFTELAAVAGRSVVQVLAFPTWGPAALTLRQRHGWPIVYDCHDLLEGFSAVAPDIVGAELSFIEQADHVIFSSMWLQQYVCSRLPVAGKQTSLLRNAVQRRFFDACSAERERHTSKVAGYFGALDAWFDIDAVRCAASRYPGTQFQLIGRVEHPPVLALRSLSNVEFTGEVPYEDLPRFLMRLHVGLIPFQVNDLTRAANPIKLYEYFSAGIPVVSTRLPEVEPFGDLVYVADDADSFAELVGAALTEDSEDDRRMRRVGVAARETWEHRAECLLQIAKSVLAGSR
jgi:glycosyltransferase involved in cell wall biosynthesis